MSDVDEGVKIIYVRAKTNRADDGVLCCGATYGSAWVKVMADMATQQALYGEQYLDVSDVNPADKPVDAAIMATASSVAADKK